LGIHRSPETIANPKDILEEAIRIARKDFPQKRRKDLRLTELYLPIGQKLDLSKLEILDSYKKFKKSVRDAFKELNYLH
jgi:dimeric dUTPase (all-alpha-NTP-PPase superfamily)